MLRASSLTPKALRLGSAGGGGPFFCGGDEGVVLVPFDWNATFSLPSGTEPITNVLFLLPLPNQLPLFFRDKLGWLLIVAGDPGRSDVRLSCEDSGRRPRNLRTDDGRLLEGLEGDRVLAPSLVVGWWRLASVADSELALASGDV